MPDETITDATPAPLPRRLNLRNVQRRAGALTETRTFADPSQPGEGGEAFTITLRATGGTNESLRILEYAEDLIQTYVQPPIPGMPPAPVPFSDGSHFQPSENLCRFVAPFAVLQIAPLGADSKEWQPYSDAELFEASEVLPTAWAGASVWAKEFRERASLGLKNDSGAAGSTFSGPPSGEAPATALTS